MVLGEDWFSTCTPNSNSSKIAIPVNNIEPLDTYSQLDEPVDIQNYYNQNGYVVFRNLLPVALCTQVQLAFKQEVKPYDGYMYRQTALGSPEKHKFTATGYLLNSIINLQSLNNKKFPQFKKDSLAVITHEKMYDAVKTILGEPGTLVQSMFFEGNPVTWAHQDTYYLDSTELGRMTAAWIALEDIQPGAGRFYIYPGSHKIDLPKNGSSFDVAFNHSSYKELVLNTIKKHKLEYRAPALRKGHVLFWSAKTIHGSLETFQPNASRCSVTAHFIPNSTGFLQFQKRQIKLNLHKSNSFQVHCSKNQNTWKNQAIFYGEAYFPKSFQFLKRSVIKLLLS